MINVPYQYNTNEEVSQGRENFWTKRRLCPEINFCLSGSLYTEIRDIFCPNPGGGWQATPDGGRVACI